jgi:hypothetical protein
MRYETLFTLQSDDVEIEYEVNVDYEYHGACGDGWNDPRESAHCTITAVTGRMYLTGGRNPTMGQPFNFLPLLTPSAIESIERACLNDYDGRIEDAMEMRAQSRRDAAE